MGKKEIHKERRLETLDMAKRKDAVARTGQDPVFEAEMHEILAAERLRDLNREAAEAVAAEMAKEKAAAAAAEKAKEAAAAAADQEVAPAAAGNAAQQE